MSVMELSAHIVSRAEQLQLLGRKVNARGMCQWAARIISGFWSGRFRVSFRGQCYTCMWRFGGTQKAAIEGEAAPSRMGAPAR